MKRRLILFASLIASCGGMYGQSCPAGHTRVADTLYGPVAAPTGQPTLFFGTVTIAANSAGTGASGAAFGKIPLQIPISNGVLSVCLIPNDTATPLHTTYSAEMAYDGDQGSAAPWKETWSVPTSGSPVTLATVRQLTTPPLLQGATGPAGPAVPGTGVVAVTNGVAGVVSGSGANCVRAIGLSGACPPPNALLSTNHWWVNNTTLAIPELAAVSQREVAWDGSSLWIAGAPGSVVKYNPATQTTLGVYPVGNAAWAVLFDGTNVWVSNTLDATVTKILASTGAILGTFTTGGVTAHGLAFDGANIWVANLGSGTVVKMLASTGAIVGTYAVGTSPYGLAFDGANIWVANSGSANVTKLLASTGAVVGTYPAGVNPDQLCFDGVNIWAANHTSNTLTKFVAATGAVVGTYPVGGRPFGMIFDGSSLWVVNHNTGMAVQQINVATGAVIATYPLTPDPRSIAWDGVNIWVTDEITGYPIHMLTPQPPIVQSASGTGSGTVTSITASSPLTGGAITGAGTIGIPQATASANGYLLSGDWSAFNAKQAALGFTPLNPANNLSDLASASTAKTNLGLAPLASSGTFDQIGSGVNSTAALAIGGGGSLGFTGSGQLQASAVDFYAPNGGSGTTLNQLVRMGVAGTVVNTALAQPGTQQPSLGVVVAGAGSTGTTAQIRKQGSALCVFDGPATNTNLALVSTTVAGNCTDSGFQVSTEVQPGRQIIGRIVGTIASAGTTGIDMNIGFTSNAGIYVPALTASLPSICPIGSSVFALDAAPGSNWYDCDPANTWLQRSVNASNLSTGTLPAARLPNPSATTLGGVESLAAASHQWVNTISTSGVPGASQPAFTDISGTATAAQLPAALSSSTSVNGTSIPASVTLTQTIASGSASLGTSAIGSGTCAAVVTSTATGTATTDNIMADFNSDPTSTTGYSPSVSGMLTIDKYPTSGNVNFKVCNNTGSSVTPGAVTLNWRVVR